MPTTARRDPHAPTLADLASATGPDRNRAVDFYRAIAMMVVALGHWLGMVVFIDADGSLDGGNLLDYAPSYGWATWVGQVMPLFFFVGGFASATSLRSAHRRGVRDVDWVATRLRRMVTPTAALAGCWLAVVVVGSPFVGFGLLGAGVVAAAIPLWFLANYTIDTALAPFTFRWFQRHPLRLAATLGAAFAVAEIAGFGGVPVIPQVNWVIGWLGFQITGFAWQSGRLPSGRRLVALAGACWTATLVAVTLGPWPAVFLHHGGLEHSPTHPPSTALLLFGFAYSFTAAALAPSVDRWLQRSARAWTTTVAANAIAMSVYLWHMTAAVVVTIGLFGLGAVPGDDPGSGAWWLTKLPIIAANLVILVVVVRVVAPIERRALLGGTSTWRRGTPSLLATAGLLSITIKLWSGLHAVPAVGGLVGTLVLWYLALRNPPATSWSSPTATER